MRRDDYLLYSNGCCISRTGIWLSVIWYIAYADWGAWWPILAHGQKMAFEGFRNVISIYFKFDDNFLSNFGHFDVLHE